MEIKRNENPQEIFTKEQIKDTPFWLSIILIKNWLSEFSDNTE